jgi:malate dehydrogenase (oxaloacetate-decarboxylating)(NADP+)
MTPPNEQLRGRALLNDARHNKSTAFTKEERERFGLRGLLPAAVCGQETQLTRALENLRRKEHDIEKYIALRALEERNERLFYRALIEHTEELLPLVYTPTVGQACKEFAHIFRQSRGLYITPEDRGRVRELLDNWPERDVRVIVVTDGERILGLGDLGANGMGIPIGKLSLYTAFAGIDPSQCLPIQLDVGTNNPELRDDPLYLGWNHERIVGEAYDTLVDELVTAVQDAFPRALIQFEDFLTPNAYRLLERYRNEVLCFNDDIQGTAAVSLAGVYASTRITGSRFEDLRVMFLGAGSAATGIGDLMTLALADTGLSLEEARRRLWFVDVHGLVVQGRDDLMPHNLPYAHTHPSMGFVEAIHTIRPHVLIGATGHAGTFTKEVVGAMAEINAKPVIFALSNPTSRAECTPEEAYRWSQGRAIFASGSPFAPVGLEDGRTLHPAQGNNAYVFPGIGLGAIGSDARRVTDEMFLAGARALADEVSEQDLAMGSLYPPLSRIRELSLSVATSVAHVAYAAGIASLRRPDDLREHLADMMYQPYY